MERKITKWKNLFQLLLVFSCIVFFPMISSDKNPKLSFKLSNCTTNTMAIVIICNFGISFQYEMQYTLLLCKYTSEYTGSLCVSDSHWKFPLFCMCLTLCHEDVKQRGYSDWSDRVQCMCSRYSMLHNRFNLWTRTHTYNVYRCRPLHLFNTKESFYSSIWRRG